MTAPLCPLASRALPVLTALLLSAALALPVAAQTPAPAPAKPGTEAPPSGLKGPELKDIREKNSYATGVMTIRNLQRNGIAFDPEMIIEGLKDALAGGAIRLSEKELRVVLQSMQADMVRNLASERQKDAVRNAQRGEAYALKFSERPGVVPLPGGMYYRVLKAGDGDKPRETGTVVVKYRGTKTDGTEFDATPEGKTVTLRLGDVITGWREIIRQMPAGSTWEVVIPPSLAYGNRGNGDKIGPNETLVFTIELVANVR